MNAKNKKTTRTDTPGTAQVLAFVIVATIVGLPSLLIGGLVVGYLAFLVFGLLFAIFFAGKSRQIFLIFYVFLAAGFLIGGLTYYVLDTTEIAARLGNWPLIGPLLEPTATKTGLTILIGAVGGMLSIGLVTGLGPVILTKLGNGILAVAQAIKFGGPIIVIDEGKWENPDPDKPPEQVVGPATLIVRPYNAIVLVKGSKVSRIEGPGEVKLEKWEGIKAAVDLRPQGEGYKAEVRTKDNFPLTVRGGVGFRIESQAETDKLGWTADDTITKLFKEAIGSDDYKVYKHTIYRAVFAVGAGKNWIDKTSSTPEGKVRDIIRGYDLEDIFPLDGTRQPESFLNELAKQATEAVQKSARGWGVTVYGVGVNEVEMPEHVRRHWEAIWQNHIKIIRAESDMKAEVIRARGTRDATLKVAEAEEKVISSFEKVKAAALKDFIDQLLRGIGEGDLIKNPQVAARFIIALEHLTRNIVADDRAAVRLTETLEKLALSQSHRLPLFNSRSRPQRGDKEEED